ncbi:MAG TPA: hypothetical protein VFV48_09905 [Pseudomonadales bacterium]|nr:hypothetical protein [Pseudomonadales bacterium]
MKRKYYLVKNFDEAKRLQDALFAVRIPLNHVHALAKDDSKLVSYGLNQLPISERKDLIADAEYGGMFGVIGGIFAAISLIAIPNLSIALTPQLLCSVAFGVGLLGMLAGGAYGLLRENYHISEFRAQMLPTQCIVMIDVSTDEKLIEQALTKSGVVAQYLKQDDDEVHYENLSGELRDAQGNLIVD